MEVDMLEEMKQFFEARLDGYDEHMLNNIECAREFYPFTAGALPLNGECKVLDLGCGTGLELEEYFKINPMAFVTGIDLSQKMLDALKGKLADKNIELVCGSYFEVELGKSIFDAAVSVESLHHFTKEMKTGLYKKLRDALKEGGYFILTDYFALSEGEELEHRRMLSELKEKQGITDGKFYHYDTPLTVAHEKEALLDAGFNKVEVLDSWGATYTLKAFK